MSDNKKNEVTEQDVKLSADELSEVSGGGRFTVSGEHDQGPSLLPNDAPNVNPNTQPNISPVNSFRPIEIM